MKNIFKKSLSIIFSLLIILQACPITAYALTENGKSYSITTVADKKYAIITSYGNIASTGVATIPQTLGGYPVIAIGANCFNGNSNLKEIVIPEGVEAINRQAFYNIRAYNIKVSLPSTLKYIGEFAFADSNISTINFPEGLEAIDTSSFENTYFIKKSQSITLPDSLKYIGESAFKNSNISEIHIGKTTTFADYLNYEMTIGVSAPEWYTYKYAEFQNPFACCQYCNIMEVDENNQSLTALDNVIYSKDMTDLISYHGVDMEYYSSNFSLLNQLPFFDELSFTVPKGVKAILPNAFFGLYVNELTVSNTVERLMDNAFSTGAGKIGSIIFEENSNLKSIERFAFNGNIYGDITIPDSVEEIGFKAFSNMKSENILFETPSNLKTIDAYAFYNCLNLTSITIPNSVTELGRTATYLGNNYYSNAFSNCKSLESVVFEDNSQIKTIYEKTFENDTAIKAIDFGSNSALVSFEDSLKGIQAENLNFSACPNLSEIGRIEFNTMPNLKSVDLSNTNLESIEKYTFKECFALESVTLSKSTHIIYDYAFYNCSALFDINLEHIRVIEPNAFNGCTALNLDNIQNKVAKITDDGLFAYGIADSEATIISYLGKDTEVFFPDSLENCPVTEISTGCFESVENIITEIRLPSYLKEIKAGMFSHFTNLKSVYNMPSTLKSIGDSAFYYCISLEEIELPDGLTDIGNKSFGACSSLKSIDLPNGLISIGDYAFEDCELLEEFILPDSVENLGNCICGCYNIKTIYAGPKISNLLIDSTYQSALEQINISPDNKYYSSVNGVLYNKDKTEIIYYPPAKAGKSYTILDTVTAISDGCFKYNLYLEEINLPNNIKKIGNYSFQKSQSLQSFCFPASLEAIGDGVFESSQIKSVEFANGFNIKVLNNLFDNCYCLTDVYFAANVQIEELYGTFKYCSKLPSIELPSSLRILGYDTFRNCNTLQSINIPKNVYKIGSWAFYKCSMLESISLNNAVRSIGENAFKHCTNLKYADVSGVEKIGDSAFESCIMLEAVNVTGVIYMGKYVFYGCERLKKLLFTNEEKDAYIAENEFKGNETVETVVIGNSITQIQDGAFADCTNLETAVISSSVTSIADDAFDNCNSLTIICLEDSYVQSYAQLKSIPYQTFRIAPIADCEYTGQEITPEITVSIGENILTDGKEYTALYQNNIKVGTATVTACGLGDYSIFNCLAKFSIVPGPNGEGFENENEQNGKEESSANKQGNSPQNSGNAQGSSSSTPQSNTAGAVKQSGAGTTAKAESTQTVSGASFNNAQEKSTDEAASKADGADTQTAENAEENGASGGAQSNKEKEKQSLWEKIVSFFASLFAFIIGKLRELFS